MATLFLDFENGNDQHAGTSFATLADGTDGRISSTTFSSAGASFPDDGSLIGQYLSIFNGTIYAVYNITAWVSATSLTIAAISGGTALANQAVDRQYFIGGRWKNMATAITAARILPGDTVRVKASPDPTSLEINATWTSQALQAAKTVTGATNATPISITCTAHGYSTGDTVVITGVGGNTNANGTWEITSTGANTFTLDGSVGNGTGSDGTARLRNNTVVRLASAVTANIASTGPGRAAWTSAGGANVITSFDTSNFKEHNNSDSISIQSGFTTGLAAYWPTGTLDLSGYQQVSFWIRQTGGAASLADEIDLRLCSDAAGVTAVNTINIPAQTGGGWIPVTVDLATNLGSSIQSIALYVNTDRGAQTFLFSNIIACKASSAADSLTLTSLIGKNTTGEMWWPIQSINGTRIMLDGPNTTPTSTAVRGYYGTTSTVETYKRELLRVGPIAGSGFWFRPPENGTVTEGYITYSGGWDRTDMSTQVSETWLDGVNNAANSGIFEFNATRTLNAIEGFSFCRASFGIKLGAPTNLLRLKVKSACACDNVGGSISGNPWASSDLDVENANTSTNVFLSAGSAKAATNFIAKLHNVVSCTQGFNINPSSSVKMSINVLNGQRGILTDTSFSFPGDGFLVYDSSFDNTTATGLFLNQGGNFYLNNCQFNGQGYSNSFSITSANAYTSSAFFSQNHDQTAGNHKIFIVSSSTNTALISAATDQRQTASGISWKMQPLNTIHSSYFPVTLSLAKVACAANSLVTIKAWMRRSNTGLTMRLVCKGGQIAGVSSDVVDAMTAAADTWAEQTITFTPTEVGVVEITAEAWGGTTFSGWVDDLTITQA